MKILIAEDEHKIANSLKSGFLQEGYIVDVTYDGVKGFDLASEGSYNVIILDLMMPGMSGEEICTKLRNEGDHTPILMLTAKSTLDDKVSGLNLGADDYMTKPFAFEELLARVKALGRRPRETQNSQLTINNLQLNTNTFDVKKDGKAINLSKKEFLIMEYLVRNKGKIVSKQELISRVWSYESDILPNNVEVFIGFIRKKLGSNIIQTVRGFGYRV